VAVGWIRFTQFGLEAVVCVAELGEEFLDLFV
jgi:hypothetical protein